MGQGKHIGKVLIQIRPEAPSSFANLDASPRVYFDPQKSYIIIGGLGGFGLELANWMTTRYAKKLVLTTRTGIADAYQQQYVDQWRNGGIAVKVLKLDASNYVDATTLVKEANDMGALGGFFNLAMQLKIGLMKTMTEEDFLYAIAPKVNLTRHIDELTRKMCTELDYFVVFSSVASGFGFDGQTNYGMANSGLERICERRVREGLPGLYSTN
jgi:fatty acid synthase